MITDLFNRDIFYTHLCGEEQALADAIGKRIALAEPNVKIGAHWHWFQQPHHGDRARQLDTAMEAAAGRALVVLHGRLAGLSLLAVWPVLRELCHDLALCLGGAGLFDALVAAGVSAGACERAGAQGGARIGADAGVHGAARVGERARSADDNLDAADGGAAILRGFIGVNDIADAMRVRLPAAAAHYRRGVAEAWGHVPDLRSADSADAPLFGADFQLGRPGDAVRHLARGHEAVVMAMLTALASALRDHPADLASLCAALRHSARLGPTVAHWVARHATQLVDQLERPAPAAREHACAAMRLPCEAETQPV